MIEVRKEPIVYQIRYAQVDSRLIENSIVPNKVRIEKLNAVNGFFIKLEQSIMKEGIRNPVVLTSQGGKITNRYGGSRVLIAQKYNLIIPAIIADFDGRFAHGELLTSIAQIEEKFKDKPRKILLKHYGINVSGCEHYHLNEPKPYGVKVPKL